MHNFGITCILISLKECTRCDYHATDLSRLAEPGTFLALPLDVELPPGEFRPQAHELLERVFVERASEEEVRVLGSRAGSGLAPFVSGPPPLPLVRN